MNLSRFLLGVVLLAESLQYGSASAQCNAPEIVKGADKYNALVCDGNAAIKSGDRKKALGLFLAASKQTTLEFPNLLLFGRIEEVYARLGQFREADLYLQYDNLSLLWLIGVVRCQAQENTENEVLLQDGTLLRSYATTHMAEVLCGPIYDNNSYFGDRNAESFVSVAKAILRYDALRKEINDMRSMQQKNQGQDKGKPNLQK
ncbi:MAG: hypothetical protein WA802_11280 [Terracidiphilus sp.]